MVLWHGLYLKFLSCFIFLLCFWQHIDIVAFIRHLCNITGLQFTALTFWIFKSYFYYLLICGLLSILTRSLDQASHPVPGCSSTFHRAETLDCNNSKQLISLTREKIKLSWSCGSVVTHPKQYKHYLQVIVACKPAEAVFL